MYNPKLMNNYCGDLCPLSKNRCAYICGISWIYAEYFFHFTIFLDR